MIYIPFMVVRRKQAIIEDCYTDSLAIAPMTIASATLRNMGHLSQDAFDRIARVDELSLTPKYLATIDGERNGVLALKWLYQHSSAQVAAETTSSLPSERSTRN